MIIPKLPLPVPAQDANMTESDCIVWTESEYIKDGERLFIIELLGKILTWPPEGDDINNLSFYPNPERPSFYGILWKGEYLGTIERTLSFPNFHWYYRPKDRRYGSSYAGVLDITGVVLKQIINA